MHENGRIPLSPPLPRRRVITLVALLTFALCIGGPALLGRALEAMAAVAAPSSDPWALRDLVVAVAWFTASTAVVVLTVCTLATIAAASTHGTLSIALHRLGSILPQSFRRLVLAACGAALTVNVSAAHASPSSTDTSAGRPGDSRALTGLRLPDLPVVPRHQPSTEVVVQAGQSLWSIAEDLTGPGTPPEQIAPVVERLYAANAHVIGPDPDLILPGTHLTTEGAAP